MNRFKLALPAAHALLALLLAACANDMSGPAPAAPNIEARSCGNGPEIVRAQQLTIGTKQAVVVDENSACWQLEGGGKSIYLAFRLPPSAEPLLIGVTSAPSEQYLFSPHLLLLDQQGKMLRELPREAFLFHGTSLHAGLRTHPGEEYLIVASDPKTVGQQVSQIAEHTQQTVAMVGAGFIVINSGRESVSNITFAPKGLVTVTVDPLPKVN